MLASHPAVYTGPETHFFDVFAQVERAYSRPLAGRKVGLHAYFSPDSFCGFLRHSFMYQLSMLPLPKHPVSVFLEKTPQHGLYLDLIHRLFPDAKFIHLIRDGRDVVASLIRVSESWGRHWAPRTVGQASLFWRKHVLTTRALGQEVLPPFAYLEIRYEELKVSPTKTLHGIFSWLGIGADDEKTESIVQEHSLDNVLVSSAPFRSIPGGDYPTGFIGTGPRFAQMSRYRRLKVEALLGDLLLDLGYIDKENPLLAVWGKWLRRHWDQVAIGRVGTRFS